MRPVPDGPPFIVSTWVSISGTCPDVCTFKDNGCYAQAGATHLVMGRLDRASRGRTSLSITLEEAAAIDELFPGGVPQDGARGGRDMRLHVGGDVSCRKGAKALGEAVARFQKRGGGRCWTYTHRWREVPREAWGPISVLASVERIMFDQALRQSDGDHNVAADRLKLSLKEFEQRLKQINIED